MSAERRPPRGRGPGARSAALVLAALCAAAPRAHAQGPIAPPDTTPDVRARARAHYREGSAAFKAGRYDDAITRFGEAYALDPVAALLLNIAQSHRLKSPRDCGEALRHYELYLAAEPRAVERPEVEQYISAMRACARADQATLAPAEPSPPAPLEVTRAAPAPRGAPSAVWVTGAGAVLAAAGGVLLWRAHARFEELAPTCPCPDRVIDPWQTATRASYGLLAGGGLLAVAGAVWWWRTGAAATGERFTLRTSPWLNATGGGWTLGGTF